MKKLQNCLYITKDGAYLHKELETLVIEQRIDGKKKKLMQLPIHSIGHIFCFGNVMVSPQVMGFCGENGTGLSFFNMFGRFQARVVGKQTGNVLLRRAQYNATDNQSVVIARSIIASKIRSSKSVLMRHARNHGETGEIKKVVGRHKQIIEELKVQTNLERIRGLEGEAASHYFSVFNNLITVKKTDFKLNGRTRRPPKDPVNAMLSFLYSVLGNEVSSALQGVGLDPQVGFLHQERPGRDSLAQDLLEEFRAYIVDRLVLTLINRQQVKIKDFDYDVLGGVVMKDATRKLLLQAYQAKKQEVIEHKFLSEKVEIGLLPHIQAMLLARYIRGDLAQYPPFYID
ncbi:type I-C CRISPR-associated endonuclease Cas1c [Paraglaciecola aquimarina]|uniref:CRISPR-associated endonuclease Cas1 n=1 Tax=Paraglaciecola aquimarina TaxID=1235557 RepID=A0ABU3T0N0_9ALTE|nr:type I-C CRISPR-associated endonuclease Cas1c [Paraglaciecola aquimarina]MDU0355806.1 type I-C CRISPR-associated endonuclease Cas1c [Paraglaciecola aquimarina]